MSARARGSAVVGYVRSPLEPDHRLGQWELELTHYAGNKGWHLGAIVKETRTSGVTQFVPGFNQMIRDLDKGKYVGVIVPSLSHFGVVRSTAMGRLRAIQATSAWIEFTDGTSADALLDSQ